MAQSRFQLFKLGGTYTLGSSNECHLLTDLIEDNIFSEVIKVSRAKMSMFQGPLKTDQYLVKLHEKQQNVVIYTPAGKAQTHPFV